MPLAWVGTLDRNEMTSTHDALTPMNEISIIGIWIETVLYGVNCGLFGLCMFTLLLERKIVPLRWVLMVMSTIIFLLCTIHIGASLQQLLEAFVYAPANSPYYSMSYWLDYTRIPSMMKGHLFTTLVFTQGLILIWRVYVVFAYRRKVILAPIILLTGCMGTGYAGASMYMMHGFDASVVTNLVIIAWVLGLVLNVLVTAAIVTRLWQMDRKMDSLTATSTNRFTSSIYIMIESSALSAVADTILLGFFASHSPATMSSMNVMTQLGLTPLLIIVQVGFHRSSRGGSPVLQEEITFRVGITQDSDSPQDLPLHAAHSYESSPA